jgi:hypothetical protein
MCCAPGSPHLVTTVTSGHHAGLIEMEPTSGRRRRVMRGGAEPAERAAPGQRERDGKDGAHDGGADGQPRVLGHISGFFHQHREKAPSRGRRQLGGQLTPHRPKIAA